MISRVLVPLLIPSSAIAYSVQSRTCFVAETIQRIQGVLCLSSLFLAVESASARNLPDTVVVSTAKSGSIETLEPILGLQASLKDLLAEFEKETSIQSSAIHSILRTIPNTKRPFESLFDAYSDPVSYKQKFVDQNAFLVYYTKGFDGPGRPSIESGLPVKQTLQYGFRNDCWIAYEQFLSELDFQTRNPQEVSFVDLTQPLSKAIECVSSYINVSKDMEQ